MRITYDPAKRARTLAERGLDFEDASSVFAGVTVEIEDTRKDFGERRIICYGTLGPYGRRRLHPAWPGPPHLQHEQGQ